MKQPKPCPFCGSTNFFIGYMSTTSFLCGCRDCGACGPAQTNLDQDANLETVRDHSIDDWNNRTGDAKELGRQGGLKGGPARAAKMTAKQRSDSAKKAARARWSHRKNKEK